MKKIINLTILSTIILSLSFIPAIPTNAASKVNITYYAGKGHFKAKPNRSKSKINIKNKINKNVAMLLLSNVMDILLMVGTLRKRWQEIFSFYHYYKESKTFILIG